MYRMTLLIVGQCFLMKTQLDMALMTLRKSLKTMKISWKTICLIFFSFVIKKSISIDGPLFGILYLFIQNHSLFYNLQNKDKYIFVLTVKQTEADIINLSSSVMMMTKLKTMFIVLNVQSSNQNYSMQNQRLIFFELEAIRYFLKTGIIK